MKWDCRARRKSRRPDTKASVLKLLVLVYERQILAIANICARCSRATTQVSACNPAKWDNSNGGPVPKPESNRCCWSGVPRDQDSQGKASVGAGCKRSFDPAPATKIESPWFIRIKGFSYWRSGPSRGWGHTLVPAMLHEVAVPYFPRRPPFRFSLYLYFHDGSSDGHDPGH